MPPEEFRAGEFGVAFAHFLPKFSTLNQMVGLLPELHFREFAIVPAIPDDPMGGSRSAGEVSRLRRAGHRRKSGNDCRASSLLAESVDSGSMGTDERVRKTDNVDNGSALHSGAHRDDFLGGALAPLL